MFKFIKKIKPYFLKYTKQLIIFFTAIMISLLLDIIKIFWTVDLMDFDTNTPVPTIVNVICGIAIFTVLISICGFVGQMTLDFVIINIFKKVRKDIYNHISNLKVDFAKSGIEGDFLTRWASDLPATQTIFMSSITALIISPIATIIYTIYLTMKRWDLLLVSLFPVLLSMFITNRYGKYVDKRVKETTKEQERLNHIMKDSVVCIQIVKIYMLLQRLRNKFSKINFNMTKICKDISKATAFTLSIQNLMWFDMGSIMCYAYGGYLCYTNKMDLVSLFVFKFIFSALTNCITNLPMIIANFRVNTFYINRVFDIFDYEIEEIPNNKLSDVSHKNHIEFRNVSFSYGKKDILKDCCFEIERGERVAIAGENCKTTILNLMCGFYTVNKGSISICGYDINTNNLEYIRNKISIVEQESTVFLGTIKENIICGYEYNKKRFEDAVEMSLTSSFVEIFSNEYNTYINGQGSILSGGQCQRLNLARALYKNSEILLLDNYTSALDNDTKKKIYSNMNSIKNRTIVVFSNNVYDLEQVDRVILLKDGQVYRQGKHKDILKECDYYQKILNQNNNEG